jgi:hypothetical protein
VKNDVALTLAEFIIKIKMMYFTETASNYDSDCEGYDEGLDSDYEGYLKEKGSTRKITKPEFYEDSED